MLDAADLPLARAESSGQFDLRAPGGAAYLSKVNHDSILHSCYIAFKLYRVL